MLGHDTGDVVVDNHHFVDQILPLGGEHPDRGGAATDPHAMLGDTVDHRRLAGLDDDRRAAFHGQFDGLLVAQCKQGVASHAAFGFRAAGQVPDAAERQHLRAVLGGGDVSDRLAVGHHRGGLGTEMPVGIDLHLDAAIAEDALGHDRDQVDALDLLRHDEGCRLVVGIGGARADAGHETRPCIDEIAVPRFAVEWHDGLPVLDRMFENAQWIGAHDAAVEIAVSVACAGTAFGDIAHHGAGIAAQLLA